MEKIFKNIIVTVLAIIVMIINVNITFAADTSKIRMLVATDNIEKEKNFSIYVSQYVDGGISGIDGTLEFDEEVLTLKSINDFPNEEDETVWGNMSDVECKAIGFFTNNGELSEQEKISELIFAFKESSNVEETQIKITDVKYFIPDTESEGEEKEIDIDDVVLTVKLGNSTSGNNSSGNNSSGNKSSGNNSSGNNSSGNNSSGNSSSGNNSSGNSSSGNSSSGNSSSGNSSSGNSSSGDSSSGNSSSGNSSSGNSSSGNSSSGNSSSGNNSSGNSSSGNKSSGNNSSGNNSTANATTLPKTGSSGFKIAILGFLTIIFGTVMYLQYRKYKGI